MKNYNKRDGFKNRHLDGLAEDGAIVRVVIPNNGDEEIMLCEWESYNKEDYHESFKPDNGYLGHLRVVQKKHEGIGFNCWEQSNSEFIYYKIV